MERKLNFMAFEKSLESRVYAATAGEARRKAC